MGAVVARNRSEAARIRKLLDRKTGRPRQPRSGKAAAVTGILDQLKHAGLPAPETEHQFHPRRKWAFDFAWPSLMVGAEREGGTWTGGRHVRGKGYEQDAIKYSEAAILGWRVIRFTPDMERDGLALDLIGRAIEAARRERRPKKKGA